MICSARPCITNGFARSGTSSVIDLPSISSGMYPRILLTIGLIYTNNPRGSISHTISGDVSTRDRNLSSLSWSESSACLRSVISRRIPDNPTTPPERSKIAVPLSSIQRIIPDLSLIRKIVMVDRPVVRVVSKSRSTPGRSSSSMKDVRLLDNTSSSLNP
ncbi:MAG: hypothetical protein A4E42_01776 [Methanoregulaceae archaeon PtaU1.Bin222]|nr:MAG: hypothetical protein A4E42_01776 [Methanoregulaceae archaeon PtaU1.Bin222]